MEKCTGKNKKDSFGPQLMRDKAQNTFLQINMGTLTINQMIIHRETISL